MLRGQGGRGGGVGREREKKEEREGERERRRGKGQEEGKGEQEGIGEEEGIGGEGRRDRTRLRGGRVPWCWVGVIRRGGVLINGRGHVRYGDVL